MIISRTPFRVSFAGGGTDLRNFYIHDYGAVTSTTIDKYMFITVNKRFDHTIRVSYSKTEIVNDVDEIKHGIVREALKLLGIHNGVEIHSMADVPAGTGIGSSSSFTVGLLNALHAYKGEFASAKRLAEEACQIEIDILKEPIGKQDQYIAAYGGLQHIQFNADESVFVDPVICSRETRDALNANLMMFYTGVTRNARDILERQSKDTPGKLDMLRTLRDISEQIRDVLIQGQRLDTLGELLHESWLVKKKIIPGISNHGLDEIYQRARDGGAVGGKILGAGGGGFFLLYVEPHNRENVRSKLKDLKEFQFSLEAQGSKIIYVGE
jgi:D-glycero-alpha-D-manno-heptose-7-phosphate kinase